MNRLASTGALLGLLLAAGCQRGQDEDQGNRVQLPKAAAGPGQQVGVTPMQDRVAVIGLLNKRNGIVRDLRMKPGMSVRVKDVIVRLRACEATAPWENEKLTGAFLQLDVQQPDSSWRRVFSGWVYKESPSLNVVEHPIYDVWPKSCAMTHPDAGPSTVRVGSAASNRSSAPNSAAAGKPKAGSATTPPAAPAPSPSGAPADSATSNSAR